MLDIMGYIFHVFYCYLCIQNYVFIHILSSAPELHFSTDTALLFLLKYHFYQFWKWLLRVLQLWVRARREKIKSINLSLYKQPYLYLKHLHWYRYDKYQGESLLTFERYLQNKDRNKHRKLCNLNRKICLHELSFFIWRIILVLYFVSTATGCLLEWERISCPTKLVWKWTSKSKVIPNFTSTTNMSEEVCVSFFARDLWLCLGLCLSYVAVQLGDA